MQQIILHWLSTNIATVATWIVGIGAVGVVIKKYGPIARKWVKIIREGMDMVDTLLDALQDDKITDDEIAKVVAEAQAFKDALK